MCKRWAKLPTGVGVGMAKIFLSRVWGYPGLLFVFIKFGFRGEYSKVRYTSFWGRCGEYK